MASEEVDLNEFLCFNKAPEEDKFFNRERTLKLLGLYKSYKKKLGTFEVRSMKKLWELVARDISNEYQITILASKCENRFKVLERNYKKVVDNNNRTGRGRKVFEFEKEMEEIFQKRRNVHPVLLLSSEQNKNDVPLSLQEESESVVQVSVPEIEPIPSCSNVSGILIEEPNVKTMPNTTPIKKSLKRKRIASPSYQKRNDILGEMKNDLKKFYERRDKREEEKLSIEKEKLVESKKKTEIAREYIEILKKKRYRSF